MRINKLITLLAILPLVTTLSAKSMQNHTYSVGQHKSTHGKKGVQKKLRLYPESKYNSKMVQTAITLATLATLKEKRVPTGETETVYYEEGQRRYSEEVPITVVERPLIDMYKDLGFKLLTNRANYKALIQNKDIVIIVSSSKDVKKAQKLGDTYKREPFKKLKVDKNALIEFKALRHYVKQTLKRHKKAKVYIVGIGHGGSVAALVSLYVDFNFSKKIYFYSIDSPRVSYKEFYTMFEKAIKSSFHISTKVDKNYNTPSKKKWNHVGKLLRLNLDGKRVALNKIKDYSYSRNDVSIVDILTKHYEKCLNKNCYKIGVLEKATKKEREGRYK